MSSLNNNISPDNRLWLREMLFELLNASNSTMEEFLWSKSLNSKTAEVLNNTLITEMKLKPNNKTSEFAKELFNRSHGIRRSNVEAIKESKNYSMVTLPAAAEIAKSIEIKDEEEEDYLIQQAKKKGEEMAKKENDLLLLQQQKKKTNY